MTFPSPQMTKAVDDGRHGHQFLRGIRQNLPRFQSSDQDFLVALNQVAGQIGKGPIGACF